MKIVIAVDSFKGSLSSAQAGAAISEAAHAVWADARIVQKTLADGGEGTVEAFIEGAGAEKIEVKVTGPLGTPVNAAYAILADGETAVIEVAAAAGLTQVPPEARNPLHTTSYGVGELIRDAVSRGCRHFIVGMGGSATNDCGLGMLEALGFRFFDAEGSEVGPYGRDVLRVASIDVSGAEPALSACSFEIACDVTNPLCGENGASAVFGPQKGATKEMIAQLDAGLKAFAETTAKKLHRDMAKDAGSGAAGGLGYAFRTYLCGRLKSGIDIVLDAVHMDEELIDADLVVTGEGRLDFQTAMGKAPIGAAKRAKRYGCTVIAFAGAVTEEAERCNEEGIDAYFPIVRGVTQLSEAMEPETAYRNLRAAAKQAFLLIAACGRKMKKQCEEVQTLQEKPEEVAV